MPMGRPAVLPKLLAVIGDDDQQRVVQNTELPELADKLLDAMVVVGDLGVVAVHGATPEQIRVDALAPAVFAGDRHPATLHSPVPQPRIVAVELRRLCRICEL